jgi:molybdopterin synthase sulfur carrier subunit
VIKIKVHTILGIKEAIGEREVEVSVPEGSTLQRLLIQMVKNWGEKLSSRLFEPGTERPLPHIRLMVNGRDMAFLDNMATVLQDGDQVLIFPPVSGG